jgi:hypothetical protein
MHEFRIFIAVGYLSLHDATFNFVNMVKFSVISFFRLHRVSTSSIVSVIVLCFLFDIFLKLCLLCTVVLFIWASIRLLSLWFVFIQDHLYTEVWKSFLLHCNFIKVLQYKVTGLLGDFSVYMDICRDTRAKLGGVIFTHLCLSVCV